MYVMYVKVLSVLLSETEYYYKYVLRNRVYFIHTHTHRVKTPLHHLHHHYVALSSPSPHTLQDQKIE